MKLGFTGTRSGMTSAQIHALRSFFLRELPEEFHHGCCVGADTQANYVAAEYGVPLVFHPPINRDYASDLSAFLGERRKPQDYLVRNHNIVDETDVLVAAPRGPEVLRSGTWATVRYAKLAGKRVVVIDPAGFKEELT